MDVSLLYNLALVISLVLGVGLVATLATLSYAQKNRITALISSLERQKHEIHTLIEACDRNKFEREEVEKELSLLKEKSQDLEDQLKSEQQANSKILSQKKSSEVRLAAIAENTIPLIAEIPYNSKNLHHLGQPIDYLYFDYDSPEGLEIVFVEVKSGASRESSRQRAIKNAIRQGKVFYDLLTLNEKGIKIKRAENEYE